MILALLDDQPSHGYELGKLIELRSGGEIRFNVSTLYRVENDGWITDGGWRKIPGVNYISQAQLSLAPGGTI